MVDDGRQRDVLPCSSPHLKMLLLIMQFVVGDKIYESYIDYTVSESCA